MTSLKSLMTQFIIGASFLISSILLLVFSQYSADHTNKLLSQWQHQGEQLRYEISALQQQAQHYKLNAPRDFDSYERDKSVFFKQFQQQLNNINTQNQALNTSLKNINTNTLLELLNTAQHTLAQNNPLNTALDAAAQWNTAWETFDNDLLDALGDPNNPRLEWGADEVIKNQQQLLAQTQTINKHINTTYTWFNTTYGYLKSTLIGLVFSYLFFSMIALAYFVIRPIVLTSRACTRVAMGEYGLSINSQGSKETKQLQKSFNDLSATTKLIMDLLKEVNQAGNTQEKLQHIYYSAQKILGINWIGLMAVSDQHIELLSSASHRPENTFRHSTVSLYKRLGKDMQHAFKEGWFEITELGKMTLQHHDERFLRELHTQTRATQVIGHPFHCPKHNGFLLLLTTNQTDGFTQQQIALAHALVKLMSDAMIAGLATQTETDSNAYLDNPVLPL